MSARRRSARQKHQTPQFCDTPVTGHLPPAALYRDTEGRYCVFERQPVPKHPVKLLNYDGCEPPQPAKDASSQEDVPGGRAATSTAREKEGADAQTRQRRTYDATPLSRRAAEKTASASALEMNCDKGENSQSANDAATCKSTPNHSASSGSSARRLTLALSSPESSPSPARPRPLNPSNSSSPALKRPFGTTGRSGVARPQSGLLPGTPAGLPSVAGSRSLTPGAFDSDEDDIFEYELRSRIGDVITLLRGDTDLSANGDGDGGGASAEGSGERGDGGSVGASAKDKTADLGMGNSEPLGSKRFLDFENIAELSEPVKGGKNDDNDVPLSTNGPPCRLPPACVTADNSLAARARHVVGRRPGERIVSELAELARSPGSPLLRQAERKRARLARSGARSTTPRGRGAREARDVRSVVGGEETPAAVKKRLGDTQSPRRQAGDPRSPLVERQTNGLGADSPVLGRPEAASGKTRGWIMSPESGVLRRRSDLNASGDGHSSTDTGSASHKSAKRGAERNGNARTAEVSPRVAMSPLKRKMFDRENQSPRAMRTSPRLVSRDIQRHLSVPAAGCAAEGATGATQRHLPVPKTSCSAAGTARALEEEEEDAPCTQPVTGLVLDGVVAIVDVRSGADNRSEPVRAQLRTLGALVLDRFTKQVTHVVFKDGSKATYDRARRDRLRLVSALWVDACRQQKERVTENLFPPAAVERYESPLFPARLRKLRSMQPRDFEEEVAAADRRFRRRKRQQRGKPATTSPAKRPAMTSPKRWCRRGTVEQLLTPRGQRSGSADPGSSEDDLPLGARLFNRFMSPAGGWSTGGALRRPASPTTKLAAQISASPDLGANQRRANKTGSFHTTTSDQSAAGKKDAPLQKGPRAASTKPSTSSENPVPKPGPSGATNSKPKPKPTTAPAASKPKRSLRLSSDSDSDHDSIRPTAVSAPPAHRRRRRRLMTPPESQSLLIGPLLQPVTPAPTEQRRRPVAVVHPALRSETGRKGRTAERGGRGGGVGVGAGGVGASGSVRRLNAPRRSSLDFEAAKPRPPPPRGKMVLTNLRSVERDTLLPVISKLGDVAVMEEVTLETTHVISGQSRRTVSVLGALAVGAWLLPPGWTLASLEAGRWLPETKYEQSAEWPAAGERRAARGTPSLAPAAAVDETGLTETTFGVSGGAAAAAAATASASAAASANATASASATATASAGIAAAVPVETEAGEGSSQRGVASSRKCAAGSVGVLLPGVKPGLALFAAVGPVFISGDTRPPPAVLAGLVRLAGGAVAASARGASVAVGRPCRGVESVTEQWLLDSLQMNRLLVRQRYLQRQGAGKE